VIVSVEESNTIYVIQVKSLQIIILKQEQLTELLNQCLNMIFINTILGELQVVLLL